MVKEIEKPHPGFQGSETSSCEVVIHSQGNDPIVFHSKGSQPLTGQYRTDPNHSLFAVSTSKVLETAGTFNISLKPSKFLTATLFDQVVDDDWVDIIFKRHGRVWHTMRGTVDTITRNKSVSGSGATSTVWNIQGRDFQKIFEISPIWFNRLSLENLGGAWFYQIYSSMGNIASQPPNNMVYSLLISWMEMFGKVGRMNWLTPETLPNTLGNFVLDAKRGWNDKQFSGDPKRAGIAANLLTPTGTIWTLAKEWSDPALCELFCDLGKNGKQLGPDEELDVKDSQLGIFFRDRPFPLTDQVKDDGGNPPPKLGLEKNSAWFSLPLHIIPRQQIVNDSISRGGTERFNAFMVSPQVTQEVLRIGALDVVEPLWQPDDIARHGFRRYDIMSRYIAENGSLLFLSVMQRYMLRDWYAINPYLFNGAINLGMGRPEIHVGTRIRIPGEGGDTTLDETYYVESVNHNWQFGVGLRTSLGVTRGYIGTDNMLMNDIKTAGKGYVIPEASMRTTQAFAQGAVTEATV